MKRKKNINTFQEIFPKDLFETALHKGCYQIQFMSRGRLIIFGVCGVIGCGTAFLSSPRVSLTFNSLAFRQMSQYSSPLVAKELALKGRDKRSFDVSETHHAKKDHRTLPPFPEQMQLAIFGMGCFLGSRKTILENQRSSCIVFVYLFVYLTGCILFRCAFWFKSQGYTPNPTYKEVCSGRTGHTEVVRVIFDPTAVSYAALLKAFWEAHDPTQGMRQGNDHGTQYRSCIYCYDDEQLALARQSKEDYEKELKKKKSDNTITTEIRSMSELEFYYAGNLLRQEQLKKYYKIFFKKIEDYHQQYLSKEPDGYCGLKGTGVTCPLPKKEKKTEKVQDKTDNKEGS
ncbi:hypothetical protein RFI_06814 [Reticulomyxa filosa]|uniref:peptide-methionine (S)-S-oxide reductase n=1 Tax=Reticulomyxa filosa TaxID=46433 RepID=X6NWU7_RETFI|nr:hypothetical protein RFI_06814 [Reticulomyxa filosa]|eukprot:ETO30304.1 hypothetical protein RFI_06814 [Reticulomyxa filosa]